MDYDDEDDMYDDMEEDDGHWVHANAPGSLNGLRACIPWFVFIFFSPHNANKPTAYW